MAFMAIRISPRMILLPAPELSLDEISMMAPEIPQISPLIIYPLTFSLRKKKAVMVISNGVQSSRSEAWIEYVMESPLIKSNWLMAIPVTPQAMNNGMSLRLIFFTGLSQICMIHNSDVVTRTRATLSPKGFNMPGVTNFTTLKLILKIRLAARTAICAFMRVLKERGRKNLRQRLYKSG
jgi:hypothetical protein